MKTFRIKQNFGDNCYGFVYFDIDENSSKEQIMNKALEFQKDSFEKRIPSWFGIKKVEKPTLRVEEYSRETKKLIGKGMKFSVKWR